MNFGETYFAQKAFFNYKETWIFF